MVRGVSASFKHLLQAGQPLLGIDVKHLGLLVLLQVAAFVEAFEQRGSRREVGPPFRTSSSAEASCISFCISLSSDLRLPSRNIRSRLMSRR